MSPIQSVSWRALALIGAAGAVACGDARPTAPDAVPRQPTLSLTSADSIAVAGALGDLQSRITPTLGRSAETLRLDAALGRVGAAIAGRDRSALESALAEGDAAIDALAGADRSGAAAQDLDVVRLVLAQGRALLTAQPDGPSTPSRVRGSGATGR